MIRLIRALSKFKNKLVALERKLTIKRLERVAEERDAVEDLADKRCQAALDTYLYLLARAESKYERDVKKVEDSRNQCSSILEELNKL